LQRLWLAIKDVGASHDSEVRYPPPQCHPDTRQEVLTILRKWIYNPSPEDQCFWLYGPAGAGKSAIAQTIAETGQQEDFLVSSFFFSRGDPNRSTAKYLFLSIAYGLAKSIPELQEPIALAIKGNPALLQVSLDEQFQKLVIEPCNMLVRLRRYPWLIVIDGLDECYGTKEQRRVLFIIARALSKLTRFRFLICSRPEPSIRQAFNTDQYRPYLRRVALDETFNPSRDIKKFLTASFKAIRRNPRNQHIRFPKPWPASGVVDELNQKASGQFIYATTVVKFRK
ncbi:hypothetical protein MPER_09456, partial [Moniliophthora perniciosa FA553]